MHLWVREGGGGGIITYTCKIWIVPMYNILSKIVYAVPVVS